MQTILGANGSIGVELAKNLKPFTDRIRLVSRNPRKVNSTDETLAADLRDAPRTLEAVAGSTVAYLTVGLPYSLSAWRMTWPVIMRNVIDACKKHKSKLVFFDNVYLYGRVDGWMTEETPVHPISRKGKVRAAIVEMLMDEVRKGDLSALIARAADFYGPRTPTSVVNILVFDAFSKGRKAQWLMNDRVKHSFTYTPDAGRATALLGNSEKAFNQVWHLPTEGKVLTGKQFIEAAAGAFGVEPRYRVLTKGMLRMLGLFNGVVRESIEMLYQNDSDYLFDSGKFDRAFDFKATSYEQGIKETVESIK